MLTPVAANAILTEAQVVPRAEWIECAPRRDGVEVCTIGRGDRVWSARVWTVNGQVRIKLREEHVPKPDAAEAPGPTP